MFAVIRLRGSSELRKDFEDTLRMIRLKAPNNCVLVPETEDYKGMLEKSNSACTWGEIEKETLAKMMVKRLRTEGDKKVDEKMLKEITGIDSFEKFADALISGKIKLKDFKKLKPVFRLPPPSKGFKSIRNMYPKGDLGYRKKEINKLLEKMI